MSKPRGFLFVAIIYAALLLPPFAPFLLEGKTLYQGDIFLYFEPVLRWMKTSILSGRWPLWNPLVCCGAPQIAVMSPGLFYPPNALFLALPFGQALAAAMMFHQWLAGAGTYAFLRLTGRSAGGATVGGALVMLSGYMFGSSQCYTLAATFSWTPLVLALEAVFLRTGRLRWSALMALLFGVQVLGGRPEIFLSAALIYFLYAVVAGFSHSPGEVAPADGSSAVAASPGNGIGSELPPLLRRRRWLGSLRGLTLVLVFLGLGTGVAAVSLLPALELYSQSPRMAGLKFADVARWSAGWADWATLIMTRPLGDLVVEKYHLNPSYPGLFPYISSLFLGVPALTLAFFGFLDSIWRGRWFWGGVAYFFFLAALGEFGRLLPALYELSPGFAVLRYPIKVAVFCLFGLALAASAGWDATVEKRVGRGAAQTMAVWWFLVAMAGNLLILDPGNILERFAEHAYHERFAAHREEIIIAIRGASMQLCLVSTLGLLVAFLALQFRAPLLKRHVLFAVLAFVVLLPPIMNGPANLWHMTDADFFRGGSAVAGWIDARLRQRPGENRMLALLPDVILSPRQLWREDDPVAHSIAQSAYQREILDGDVNMDFGLRSAYGFMPTDTRAFKMLHAGVTARSRQYADPRVSVLSDAPLHRFCQVSATRFLVTSTVNPDPVRRVLEPMPPLDPTYFHLAHDLPELNARIYSVREPLPRVYFRESWVAAQSQVEAIGAIVMADASGFDPGREVIINAEGGRLWMPPSPAAGGRAGRDAEPDGTGDRHAEPDGASVRILSDEAERIDIAVGNGRPGFLVLADTMYPGWRAYDGGRRVTLYQANGFQKAVWLEPGEHRLSFRYRPYSLFWGALIGGLACAVLALMVTGEWLLGRRRRQSEG